MALAEKGLRYAYDPAPPHSEQVNAISPYGRIPVFRDGDTALFETSAIVRYLDESFDGTPLVAPNARLRAQMEQWVSMINCHAYDAMIRRYVLQYVFPKGEGGAPDRETIDGRCRRSTVARHPGQASAGAASCRRRTDDGRSFLAPIVLYLGLVPESKARLGSFPLRRALPPARSIMDTGAGVGTPRRNSPIRSPSRPRRCPTRVPRWSTTATVGSAGTG